MKNFGSWRFWVIVLLALTTLACAGRRERREEAREARAERAEQRRAERAERNEQRRAPRESTSSDEPKAAASNPPPRQNTVPAATLTPTSTAPTAAVAESKVVFMRPSGMGGAVAATVFDVTDSDSKIIGIINMRGRLSYAVKPGIHTFMVVSEAADFMQVNVIPGKTYYALVRPRMGAWKARFSFEPLRGGDSRAEQWERSTSLVNNPARAQAWFRDNAASVEDKRSRYWPEWSNKPESARAAQTLTAEDGH